MPENADRQDHSTIETLQSLIVAFVLAMTFRGYVTEGFVIPTGSMAPTLFGQHYRAHSDRTGWNFELGHPTDQFATLADINRRYNENVADPMLGMAYPIHLEQEDDPRAPTPRLRMGDRILVMKCLYPFFGPDRFDVVVFKNPTDPNGPAGNYIKRLIGLPNESVWLLDGDVFVGSASEAEDFEAYSIQRKPEHVQRAVWQPLYRSDYHPRDFDVAPRFSEPWIGPGWRVEGDRYLCDQAEDSELTWDHRSIPILDVVPYNSLTLRRRAQGSDSSERLVRQSDIRAAATVVPETDQLATTFGMTTRGMMYEFTIDGRQGAAFVRMRDEAYGAAQPDFGWEGSDPVSIDPIPAGEPTNLEFWHVDQRMVIFINGKEIASHDYDWKPAKRLRQLFEAGGISPDTESSVEVLADQLYEEQGLPLWAQLSWKFSGTPLVMHRVEVDRDLYYRHDPFVGPPREMARWNPTQPGFEERVDLATHGFGTHPSNLAILGPDEFFMCGDNSPESSDSRFWGNPHPIIALQIDPSPFVVDRRLLLGKAWVVYFPATHSIDGKDGSALLPDFGRLRFVR